MLQQNSLRNLNLQNDSISVTRTQHVHSSYRKALVMLLFVIAKMFCCNYMNKFHFPMENFQFSLELKRIIFLHEWCYQELIFWHVNWPWITAFYYTACCHKSFPSNFRKHNIATNISFTINRMHKTSDANIPL
jgi:hypothetical protein